MKVFSLRCAFDHGFDGWFASAEAFEKQCETHLVRCPLCDSADVRRIPSAARLNLGAPEKLQSVASRGAEARWLKAVRQVLQNTEDVGERFAEEARKIHYHETEERAIRGVTSESERAALAEEGIDVIPVPMQALAKGTLQ